MMSVKAVEAIASAIREGFKLVAQVMAGSEERRLRKAINEAEIVIRRYEKLTPEEDRDKKISKHITRFFKYNN